MRLSFWKVSPRFPLNQIFYENDLLGLEFGERQLYIIHQGYGILVVQWTQMNISGFLPAFVSQYILS